MSRIDSIQCHSLNIYEQETGAISCSLKWHRFKNGTQLPQGFTAKETFSTDTLGVQGATILQGVWDQIRPRAVSIVEWHEESRWADLGISGIAVYNVRVEWHRPPSPNLGLNIRYDRLDTDTGESIPRWHGDLLLEYGWIYNGERRMTINMKPDHIVDPTEAALIVAEAKQMLAYIEALIRRWEGL